MTDGNTYEINRRLDEREDYDALQEVYAELEQAEADNKMLIDRIEELELAVRYEADLAQQALDARKELEAKLDEAVCFITYIEAGPSWGESLSSWVSTGMLKARNTLFSMASSVKLKG